MFKVGKKYNESSNLEIFLNTVDSFVVISSTSTSKKPNRNGIVVFVVPIKLGVASGFFKTLEIFVFFINRKKGKLFEIMYFFKKYTSRILEKVPEENKKQVKTDVVKNKNFKSLQERQKIGFVFSPGKCT